ncbi:MAG: hypothetical protein C4320_00480 [Armatimonadota bacterium]
MSNPQIDPFDGPPRRLRSSKSDDAELFAAPATEAEARAAYEIRRARMGLDPKEPTQDQIDAIRRELDAQKAREAREARAEAAKGTGPKRYSTDYALAWGRAQGWKLIDRERYDAHTRRHHDLELGMDLRFETQAGFAYVQGAGVGERAAHYRTFEGRGGVERARKGNATVWYVEFRRGDKNPVKVEQWA